MGAVGQGIDCLFSERRLTSAFYIEEVRAEFATQEGLVWAVTLKESGTVVGLFGFHYWDRCHRRAEIGYDLARAHWGRGIASEAVREEYTTP